jgi:Protein of unknown function (DUF2808)
VNFKTDVNPLQSLVNVMVKMIKSLAAAIACTGLIATATFATSPPKLGDLSPTKYQLGAILSNYHLHVVTSPDEKGLSQIEVLFPKGMQTPKIENIWLAFGEGESGELVSPANVRIEGQKVTVTLERPITGATEIKVYFNHLTNPSRVSYSLFDPFEVSVLHSDAVEMLSHPVFLGYRYVFLK